MISASACGRPADSSACTRVATSAEPARYTDTLMPYFLRNASATALDGPVDAELYRLTLPSFFAPSRTFGSLAARAAGSQAPAASAALICSIFLLVFMRVSSLLISGTVVDEPPWRR